jgi:hypothetical protein
LDLYKKAKRIVVLVIGLTICIFGLAIGFLPGPGPIILVPLGLAILATEFAWARRWLRKYKETSTSIWSEIRNRFRRGAPHPPAPPKSSNVARPKFENPAT